MTNQQGLIGSFDCSLQLTSLTAGFTPKVRLETSFAWLPRSRMFIAEFKGLNDLQPNIRYMPELVIRPNEAKTFRLYEARSGAGKFVARDDKPKPWGMRLTLAQSRSATRTALVVFIVWTDC
jgi:hypothetical protein